MNFFLLSLLNNNNTTQLRRGGSSTKWSSCSASVSDCSNLTHQHILNKLVYNLLFTWQIPPLAAFQHVCSFLLTYVLKDVSYRAGAWSRVLMEVVRLQIFTSVCGGTRWVCYGRCLILHTEVLLQSVVNTLSVVNALSVVNTLSVVNAPSSVVLLYAGCPGDRQTLLPALMKLMSVVSLGLKVLRSHLVFNLRNRVEVSIV